VNAQIPLTTGLVKKKSVYNSIWCEDVIMQHGDKCRYFYGDTLVKDKVWTQHENSFIYSKQNCSVKDGPQTLGFNSVTRRIIDIKTGVSYSLSDIAYSGDKAYLGPLILNKADINNMISKKADVDSRLEY